MTSVGGNLTGTGTDTARVASSPAVGGEARLPVFELSERSSDIVVRTLVPEPNGTTDWLSILESAPREVLRDDERVATSRKVTDVPAADERRVELADMALPLRASAELNGRLSADCCRTTLRVLLSTGTNAPEESLANLVLGSAGWVVIDVDLISGNRTCCPGVVCIDGGTVRAVLAFPPPAADRLSASSWISGSGESLSSSSSSGAC